MDGADHRNPAHRQRAQSRRKDQVCMCSRRCLSNAAKPPQPVMAQQRCRGQFKAFACFYQAGIVRVFGRSEETKLLLAARLGNLLELGNQALRVDIGTLIPESARQHPGIDGNFQTLSSVQQPKSKSHYGVTEESIAKINTRTYKIFLKFSPKAYHVRSNPRFVQD